MIVNYNHMHALTIQYYEVVQVYRVEVTVAKADRVVFIPFELVDFNNNEMIRRFQSVLIRNALTFGIREALQKLDTVEIALDQNTPLAVLGDNLRNFSQLALRNRSALTSLGPSTSFAAAVAAAAASSPSPPSPSPASAPSAMSAAQFLSSAGALSLVQQVNDRIWSAEQGVRLAGLLNLGVLRRTSTSMFLPTDVLVEGAMVNAEGASIRPVFRDLSGRS